MSVNELIRLALVFAVQDRECFAQAYLSGDPEAIEARVLVKAFRDYHAKRYGEKYLTQLEAQLAKCEWVKLDELRKRRDP